MGGSCCASEKPFRENHKWREFTAAQATKHAGEYICLAVAQLKLTCSIVSIMCEVKLSSVFTQRDTFILFWIKDKTLYFSVLCSKATHFVTQGKQNIHTES